MTHQYRYKKHTGTPSKQDQIINTPWHGAVKTLIIQNKEEKNHMTYKGK